jgi:phosphomethylpyrimidine synthase
MCGHDWCSMRISKEIDEFDSGKDPNFQPDRRVQRSPGLQSEARGLHKEIGDE